MRGQVTLRRRPAAACAAARPVRACCRSGRPCGIRSDRTAHDLDAAVRLSDHEGEPRQSIAPASSPLPDASTLQGRVGWRWTALDRLPLIGAVPDWRPPAWAQPTSRGCRATRLFMFAALGSRGIARSMSV